MMLTRCDDVQYVAVVYHCLKGDVPVKWERIYFGKIIGKTIIDYKLTYLIDYSTLESDDVSPLWVYNIQAQ